MASEKLRQSIFELQSTKKKRTTGDALWKSSNPSSPTKSQRLSIGTSPAGGSDIKNRINTMVTSSASSTDNFKSAWAAYRSDVRKRVSDLGGITWSDLQDDKTAAKPSAVTPRTRTPSLLQTIGSGSGSTPRTISAMKSKLYGHPQTTRNSTTRKSYNIDMFSPSNRSNRSPSSGSKKNEFGLSHAFALKNYRKDRSTPKRDLKWTFEATSPEDPKLSFVGSGHHQRDDSLSQFSSDTANLDGRASIYDRYKKHVDDLRVTEPEERNGRYDSRNLATPNRGQQHERLSRVSEIRPKSPYTNFATDRSDRDEFKALGLIKSSNTESTGALKKAHDFEGSFRAVSPDSPSGRRHVGMLDFDELKRFNEAVRNTNFNTLTRPYVDELVQVANAILTGYKYSSFSRHHNWRDEQ